MARMTLEEIRNRASTVDRAKVEATTEAQIEAHRAADGDTDLDVTVDAQTVESPRAIRVRLGMTQPEIAAALRIPLGTWRNWEQGRVSLEPAAAALLRVVSCNSDAALAALASPPIKSVSQIQTAERRKLKWPLHPLTDVALNDAVCLFDESLISEAAASSWLILEEVFMHTPDKTDPRVAKYRETFASLLEDPKVRDWLTEREARRAIKGAV